MTFRAFVVGIQRRVREIGELKKAGVKLITYRLPTILHADHGSHRWRSGTRNASVRNTGQIRHPTWLSVFEQPPVLLSETIALAVFLPSV